MQLSFTPVSKIIIAAKYTRMNNSIGHCFSQQIVFFLGLNLPKLCKLYVFVLQ